MIIIDKNRLIIIGKNNNNNNNNNDNIQNPNHSQSVEISLLDHANFFNKFKHFLKKYNIIPILKINENLQYVVRLGKDVENTIDRFGVVYKIKVVSLARAVILERQKDL